MRVFFPILILLVQPLSALGVTGYERTAELVINSQPLPEVLPEQKSGTLTRILMVTPDNKLPPAKTLFASPDFQSCERKAFKTLKQALEESPERALFQIANPALHLQFRDYRPLKTLGLLARYIDIVTPNFVVELGQSHSEADKFIMRIDVYAVGICSIPSVREIRDGLQAFGKAVDAGL